MAGRSRTAELKGKASRKTLIHTPDEQPLYNEGARSTLAALIDLREGASVDDLFAGLEALARGYLSADAREQHLDPRNAATSLEALGERITQLASTYDLLTVEQERSGAVRQLLADPPVSWDEVDDAIGTLTILAHAIEKATARFRAAMGTSPAQPRPAIGWATEVFRLWRRFDRRGALGKRDGSGRFQRFLEAAAEPLQISLVWTTVHDTIRSA